MEIILASKSPRRIELLKQMGLSFTIENPECDEYVEDGWNGAEAAERLAVKKAKAVANNKKNDVLIIAGDTIVYKDEILGKPVDKEDARRMLTSLGGCWHQVITGIAVLRTGTDELISDYSLTNVLMKNISSNEIDQYINSGEPMDKAGAYGIQGYGGVFIDKIEGCYYNVVGLPISKLYDILKKINGN